jgi:hypothetical protein
MLLLLRALSAVLVVILVVSLLVRLITQVLVVQVVVQLLVVQQQRVVSLEKHLAQVTQVSIMVLVVAELMVLVRFLVGRARLGPCLFGSRSKK